MTRETRFAAFPFADFRRAREALLTAVQADLDALLLLTGDTGVGKSTLLQDLRAALDRRRYRILYLPGGKNLGPAGLIRVLARNLRVPPRRSHAETVQALSRQLLEEPQRLLVWLDDAHEVPSDTFEEARSLAESNLDVASLIQVVLVGWSGLRERLQGTPALWRRIVVREEITGLTRDELPAFLEHHFGDAIHRLDDDGLGLLFEHGRGIPGVIVSMFRTLLASHREGRPLDARHIDEVLRRWDLA